MQLTIELTSHLGRNCRRGPKSNEVRYLLLEMRCKSRNGYGISLGARVSTSLGEELRAGVSSSLGAGVSLSIDNTTETVAGVAGLYVVIISVGLTIDELSVEDAVVESTVGALVETADPYLCNRAAISDSRQQQHNKKHTELFSLFPTEDFELLPDLDEII